MFFTYLLRHRLDKIMVKMFSGLWCWCSTNKDIVHLEYVCTYARCAIVHPVRRFFPGWSREVAEKRVRIFHSHCNPRLTRLISFDNPEKLSSMATEIDLASDVIIPACTRWACEQIVRDLKSASVFSSFIFVVPPRLRWERKGRKTSEVFHQLLYNFCVGEYAIPVSNTIDHLDLRSVFDKATPDQARGAQRKAVEISNELLQEVKGRLKYVEETRLRDSEVRMTITPNFGH